MKIKHPPLPTVATKNAKVEANVLYRLKWIESYFTGLQRMKASYKCSAKTFWIIGPNALL